MKGVSVGWLVVECAIIVKSEFPVRICERCEGAYEATSTSRTLGSSFKSQIGGSHGVVTLRTVNKNERLLAGETT